VIVFPYSHPTGTFGSGAVGGPDRILFYAVYLADRRASGKVHASTEFLSKKFGSPPYWDRNESPIEPGRSKHDGARRPD
jgi:hypothetical protein